MTEERQKIDSIVEVFRALDLDTEEKRRNYAPLHVPSDRMIEYLPTIRLSNKSTVPDEGAHDA